ncbi:receptor-like protein 6 [Rhododendron vialii]|uniref:receptor-like protein 6 n=1 Tax=Rhododendron vialii TaxID=182163 RepID=UPI00265DC328|nr:receptor-like protein 6 [Rhododendron vialii]
MGEEVWVFGKNGRVRKKLKDFEKMKSWKKGSDCCSWDGVDCDKKTGQLNLAYNDFALSLIPPEFTWFTELTHLNLSDSVFSAEVSAGVSSLNKLMLHDLSENFGLGLEEGVFYLLIQNLSKLRDLDLGLVEVSSSVVSNSLLNLTSLRTLHLRYSRLHGKFPSEIFRLPYLQELDIGHNDALTGYIPDFMNLSYPLHRLVLSRTGFSGELPRLGC